MNFSDLSLRTITGAALAIVILSCLYTGGAYFVIVFSLLGACLLWEWLQICIANYQPEFRKNILITVMYVCYFGLIAAYLLGLPMSLSFLACFWVLGITSFFMRDIWASIGLLYAVLPILASFSIRFIGYIGFWLLVFLFVILWATDVFAYFTGRLVGGPKLAPKLSPNKTWSGAIGGLLGSFLIFILVVLQLHFEFLFLSVWVFVLVGVLSIVSQGGDLFESWLKRLKGVKDSGTFLPGHGGFLDRFDGFVPAVVCLSLVLNLVYWELYSAF